MKIFQGPVAPSVSIDNNYLTAWGFDADTTQFGVGAARSSKTYRLTSEVCEPELVAHSFENSAGIRLMLGNLHIRIPAKAELTTELKQKIVKEALERLKSDAPSDSATQPVVQVLVGDCNLSKGQGEEATQPMQPEEGDWRTVWQVHATKTARGGDLIFVNGASAKSFVGFSRGCTRSS